MTTYQTVSVWTEFDESAQLTPKTLGYFRGRLGNKIYQLVLESFEKRKLEGFTKAKLARRIHKSPAQITRLFNAPGNWTIDTASDILIGLGYEATVALVEVRPPTLAGVVIESNELPSAANSDSTMPIQGESAQKGRKELRRNLMPL